MWPPWQLSNGSLDNRPGFAFHLDIEGDDFFIDLLSLHTSQRRHVVIELKTTKFDPRDAGQLSFYVTLVDDRRRLPGKHQPTVGILVVASTNNVVVRYALASTTQPVAVSRYEISPEAQAALLSEKTLVDSFTPANSICRTTTQRTDEAIPRRCHRSARFRVLTRENETPRVSAGRSLLSQPVCARRDSNPQPSDP
ncbi:DUF1016 family protein [Microbacteriaceae bacterium VKM Ac-2854]|nr:DUF1016 family protein [Microbacteriaceae bacterium VKM Ac-2854]